MALDQRPATRAGRTLTMRDKIAAVSGLLALTLALPACAAMRAGGAKAPAPVISAQPGSPARSPGGTPAATGQAQLRPVHDPGQVTGALTGTCHYRDGGQLPDPQCTPGSIDPAVTQANIQSTICRSGYTKTVRPPSSQTSRFKYDQAYPAYGVPATTTTELDHLVSLELGGSNDARNLWPEQPPTPNPKDSVENRLHAAVCSGQVTLAATQRAIATNWTTALTTLGLG
jgi:hypothetical protein